MRAFSKWIKLMNRKPALIRQCEARRIIQAAKKAGAKDVTVKIGEVSWTVHLADDKSDTPPDENEWNDAAA
jgi:hypothetical protein